MEFINAPIEHLIVESHPKACYTSHSLGFTSKELIEKTNSRKPSVNLQQRNSQIEEEILKLEKIAETYYQSSQNELVNLQQRNSQFKNQLIQTKEEKLKLENGLFDLQQRNFKFEQNNQNPRLKLAKQIKEFAKKENVLQTQIIDLQNEKQNLAGNLTEQLGQNKLINQQVQDQISHLIEQKEQLENRLNQFQVNYEQIEQEKIRLYNMAEGLSQEQKQTIKLKIKLEKEIAQLEQKLIIEEQIKMQLTQALQIKVDKINELEQNLLTLIKSVFNQVNNFLKVKGDFLTLREEAIKKLQNCCNHLESSINKERNTIGSNRDMKISKLTDKYTKEFQSILVKYNDGLLELNKIYYSLKNVIQKNKELEVSLMIENILKLNSFNLDKYKIFKFATNSQEGTRIQLNSNMMAEDIDSLRKNLSELKLELNQEKKNQKI
ncbi:unnamed protein product [Rhizophagus irregularis]|nr:unnamed protein product [Rhizophagus irregularis]